MKRRKFTLIEMLVVICIIGILMSLFLVGVQHAVNAGKRTQFLADVANVRAALEQYKNKWGRYPAQSAAEENASPAVCVEYSMICGDPVSQYVLVTKLKTSMILSPWQNSVTITVDGDGDGVVLAGPPTQEQVPQSSAAWTTDSNGKLIKSWE